MAALARELARRHEVTVLTSGADRLAPESVEHGVRVIRVPVLFRRHHSVANFPSMAAYLPSAAWRAMRMRGRSAFDVVNTHFVVPTGPVGQWVADRYDLPNVLSVHGGDLYDPSKKLSPHRLGWMRRPISRLLERADAVVAQSRNTLGNVGDIYGVRRAVDLIPLGIERPPAAVSASRADFGLPADAFVLVTVGRLIPRKQITQLVAALSRSGVAKAHLLVVGSGPEEASIRSAAAAHGVAARVHFLGSLGDTEKYRAIAAADAFASTSQHEGFGLVFLEAMAMGLPVICYDHGGQTDYLATGVTGHVLPLDDVDAFGRAIRDLAGSRERCRRLGETNRARVEEFFIDRCAARYESLMERVIAGRGR
jgi:glycosyltransferase involved in cell wall biosynthesis